MFLFFAVVNQNIADQLVDNEGKKLECLSLKWEEEEEKERSGRRR